MAVFENNDFIGRFLSTRTMILISSLHFIQLVKHFFACDTRVITLGMRGFIVISWNLIRKMCVFKPFDILIHKSSLTFIAKSFNTNLNFCSNSTEYCTVLWCFGNSKTNFISNFRKIIFALTFQIYFDKHISRSKTANLCVVLLLKRLL